MIDKFEDLSITIEFHFEDEPRLAVLVWDQFNLEDSAILRHWNLNMIMEWSTVNHQLRNRSRWFFRCVGVSLIAGVLDSLESFQSAPRDGRLFLASALSKAVQEFIIILYSNSLFRMWWSGYSVRDYICRQVGSDGLNHQTKLQIVLICDKIVWWATLNSVGVDSMSFLDLQIYLPGSSPARHDPMPAGGVLSADWY